MIPAQNLPYPPITPAQQAELLEIRKHFHAFLKNTDDQEVLHILNQIYPKTNNLEKLLAQLAEVKKCLESFRPFHQVQLENLNEALDTEYTYESNRIEGNTLTLFETGLVIHKDITIAGKSVKDHLEAINHYEAIQFIRETVDKKTAFDENVLLKIHAILLAGIDRKNAGVYHSVRVRISGSHHICPNPTEVPDLMKEYFAYYEKNKGVIHPVELSANMHEKLVSVHPFIDGNRRTARLVMNVILLKNGYPMTVIAAEKNKRQDYYLALEKANLMQNKRPLQVLIAEYVKKWLFYYLDMFSQNIHEDEKGYYFFKKIQPYLNKG